MALHSYSLDHWAGTVVPPILLSSTHDCDLASVWKERTIITLWSPTVQCFGDSHVHLVYEVKGMHKLTYTSLKTSYVHIEFMARCTVLYTLWQRYKLSTYGAPVVMAYRQIAGEKRCDNNGMTATLLLWIQRKHWGGCLIFAPQHIQILC